MTTPYRHEPWESDPAHSAIQQWLRAWRESHVDDPQPSGRFSLHLGNEARGLMVDGVSRVDLVRTFTDLGYGGVCLCGKSPDDFPAAEPMVTGVDRRGRRIRRPGGAV